MRWGLDLVEAVEGIFGDPIGAEPRQESSDLVEVTFGPADLVVGAADAIDVTLRGIGIREDVVAVPQMGAGLLEELVEGSQLWGG